MSIQFPSEIRALPLADRLAALRSYLADDPRRQDSLNLRISAGCPLDPEEIDALVDLFGHRCGKYTKTDLRYNLKAVPDIPNYGVYSRIHLHDTGLRASYCAGQCYTTERAQVRKLLLK